MTFSRFVEVGRVCMINYGDLEGKLCVIIDLVDHNKVRVFPSATPSRDDAATMLAPAHLLPPTQHHLLHAIYQQRQRSPPPPHTLISHLYLQVLIDGPQSVTTIHRQMISIKRLMLTDIVVDITPEATTAELVTAMTAALPQWEATSYAKKRARSAARAETTDFDRFKIMIARKQKAKLLAK